MTTCLITGANRGIGLELARLYSARGADVIAAVRDPGGAAALTALARATGQIAIVELDVRSERSFDTLHAALGERRLDILIANAGVSGPRGGLADPGNTAEAWQEIFAVNSIGGFLTVQKLVDLVANGGKIALISSRMGSSSAASGSSYPYRASKAALSNIGANLAVELKPRGIAVGIYHPGWVKTDMGGQSADVTVERSATGLMARIDALSLATSGIFEDYAGSPISF